MNENLSTADGMGALLERAGINRTTAYYLGIGLAVIALIAVAAGVYYYYYFTPAAPEEIAAPTAETTEDNIVEASGNPAEDLPETNPFEKAQNPFDSYTNPFE